MFSDLLQLSQAFAEHLEGGCHSCIPVCEDIGRGLCDGNGVHGGCRGKGCVSVYEGCEGDEKDDCDDSMRVEKAGSCGEFTARWICALSCKREGVLRRWCGTTGGLWKRGEVVKECSQVVGSVRAGAREK